MRHVLQLPDGSAAFCLEARLRLDGAYDVWQRAFVRPDRYPCILRFSAT